MVLLRSGTSANFLSEANACKESSVVLKRLTSEEIVAIKIQLEERSKSRTKHRAIEHHAIPVAIKEVVVVTTDRELYFTYFIRLLFPFSMSFLSDIRFDFSHSACAANQNRT